MEWKINETSVVILGAGFSVSATNGALPLMRNYFDQLEESQFRLLYEFVDSTVQDVATANVERVLLSLDQIRTSPDEVLKGWADKWKANISSLQRELSHYTLDRLSNSLEIPDDSWPVELIASCGEETTVVAMNYDNIAERVLSNRPGLRHGLHSPNCPHCRMRSLLDKACSCEGRAEIDDSDWRGAVLKPHGSISWRRCLNPECCSYECLVADEHCRPFETCDCPYCDSESSPVLVMPAMSKNLNDTPEIGVMWQAARMAIAKAESILLFGFSMPSSDELLIQMIRQAVDQNRVLKRIASIDIEPEPVIERFRECVPTDINIEALPLMVTPGETPTWFAQLIE